MKKLWIRFLSVLLSCLLLGGVVPSQAMDFEDISSVTDEEMRALIDEFWAEYDEAGGAAGDLAIKGLKLIGGAVGEKIGGYIGDELWKAVFGDTEAERHAEIINRLKAIEAKLDIIIGMLKTLMHEQKLAQYKDSIQRKLTLMAEAKNMLDNRSAELRAAATQAQKHKILDDWYAMSVGNQRNSIDFFTYYCGMVANRDGMNMDGEYFAQYDAYAYLAWDWSHEGIPFRQAQREKDILFISKMAAMNILWLNKEKEQHPENIETLKEKERQLKAAIDLVVASYEANAFTIDSKTSELHGDGYSLSIYIGTQENAIAPTNQLDVHKAHLDAGHETYDIRNMTKDKFEEKVPTDLSLPSQTVHLITRQELRFIAEMAKKNKRIFRDYIVSGGFPYREGMQYVTFSDETNQPVSFGRPHGTCNSYRYLYYEVADITKEDIKTNTMVGDVSTKVFDKDRFQGIADSYRYSVVRGNNENHTEFFDIERLYPIWVLNGSNVPRVDAPEEAFPDDTEGDVLGIVEQAGDEALVLRWTEKDVRLQMAVDENTAFVTLKGEAISTDQLIGMDAVVSYSKRSDEMTDLASNEAGLPLVGMDYLVTRIEATSEVPPVDDPEESIAEGEVIAIDIREEILGKPPVVTIAEAGGALDIGMPGMSSEIEVGVLVRVVYHTEEGAHIADRVEILGNPTPDDTSRSVDGTVTALDITQEIIGKPPSLSVSIPGGEVAISAVHGLPDGLTIGSMVHVHYHVENGVNIADLISLDGHFDPAPSPDDSADPFDPVPNPVPAQAWVEGYVTQRLDDPLVLAPGQPRQLVVSAAGQDFVLQLPDDMDLPDTVREGAFVHIDYTSQDTGNIVGAILLLSPAPVNDPVPEPVDDPMPGPIDFLEEEANLYAQ